MPHVVTDKCTGCKFTDCVEVCPVACFYELDNQVVIHPEDCIDCMACVDVCPVHAIYEPIEPKRDAAMRRRAEAQCAQQMAEERLSIFGPDAKRFEHFLLQFRLMNTHAAATNLDTVENDVIGFSANFTKLLRIE